MEADYTTALSLLLHYTLPSCPGGPSSLVNDAVYLDRNRSSSAGADLIRRHSGRYPLSAVDERSSSPFKPPALPARTIQNQVRSEPTGEVTTSPNRVSGRFLNQQRGLESLFQEVSGEVSRRTEGWTIAKAVKGAVGEVRRNVNYLQTEANPSKATEQIPRPAIRSQQNGSEDFRMLTQRIQELEDRNKVLAKMLGNALESLRKQKQKESTMEKTQITDEEDLNMSLAKLQFVQVYLADPEIPIPADEMRSEEKEAKSPMQKTLLPNLSGKYAQTDFENRAESLNSVEKARDGRGSQHPQPVTRLDANHSAEPLRKSRQRPSLAESSFSFMLGEDRRRSSFVSSATVPPEERRDSVTKSMPKVKQVVAEGKETAARKGSDSDDDGFSMSSLRGPEKG